MYCYIPRDSVFLWIPNQPQVQYHWCISALMKRIKTRSYIFEDFVANRDSCLSPNFLVVSATVLRVLVFAELVRDLNKSRGAHPETTAVGQPLAL